MAHFTLLDVLIEIYVGWYIVLESAKRWHEYMFNPNDWSRVFFWLNLDGCLGLDYVCTVYEDIDAWLAKIGIKH